MGNYISCSLSTSSSKNSKSLIRVIFPKTGEIKQFNHPIKAAELMLESPNTFLTNSLSLKPGRRFAALNADEDLEKGNIYIIFPMKRVNSVITASDMGALFLAAKRVAGGGGGGGVRILPEPEAAEEEEGLAARKLNLEEIEDFSVMEFKNRLSMCRSKKPLLETIAEEPVYSRR